MRSDMAMIALEKLGIDLPAKHGSEARTLCPRCSDLHNNRKCTLSVDTERGLFQCFRCGWKGRAGGGIGWTDRRPDSTAIETQRRKRQFAIDAVLGESVPITHPTAQPARTYLSRRMGRILSMSQYPALRFHARARYYHEGKRHGEHAALIAEVRDITGRLVTLHRKYITESGHKAPLDPARNLMGARWQLAQAPLCGSQRQAPS